MDGAPCAQVAVVGTLLKWQSIGDAFVRKLRYGAARNVAARRVHEEQQQAGPSRVLE